MKEFGKRVFRNQFWTPSPKVREPHFLQFDLLELLLTQFFTIPSGWDRQGGSPRRKGYLEIEKRAGFGDREEGRIPKREGGAFYSILDTQLSDVVRYQIGQA